MNALQPTSMPWKVGANDNNIRDRSYEDVFSLSRLLGLFPYVRRKKLQRSTFYHFYSICIFLASSIVFFNFKEEIITYFVRRQALIATLLVLLTGCLASFPWMFQLWLCYMLNTLERVFGSLDRLQVMTGQRPTVCKIDFYVCAVMVFTLGFYRSSNTYVMYCLSIFPQVQHFGFLDQFVSVVKILRKYYIFLHENVNEENAQLYVRCAEIAWSSSCTLMDCYAPQILCFVVAAFLAVVCSTYLLLFTWNKGDFEIYLTFFLVYSIQLYYIMYNCTETKHEAREFDRVLYHMIINDRTNTLVRNKRIVFHFKTKRKEEFSAMGFFNFDYPLLCSMISTAITYIVILVQFS